MKSFMVLLGLATTVFSMNLRVGDTYDWLVRSLSTGTGTTCRVTVLDTTSDASIPRDSGTLWMIKLERSAAVAETLELMRFKDGTSRWFKSSWKFPVEFDSFPDQAHAVKRLGMFWGRSGVEHPSLFQYTDTSRHHYKPVDVTPYVYKSLVAVTLETGAGALPSKVMRFEGIWVDSMGPVRFRAPLQDTDWVLQAKNGVPHVRRDPFAELIRFPSPGDRYVWFDDEEQYVYGTVGTNQSYHDSGLIQWDVLENLGDSGDWIGRKVRVTRSIVGKADTSMEKVFRWNRHGLGLSQRQGNLFSPENGWAWHWSDSLWSDGLVRRTMDDPTNKLSYRVTGELMNAYRRWEYTKDRYNFINWSRVMTLLSSPTHVTGIRDRNGIRKGRDVNLANLRSLASKDPGARLQWFDAAGHGGQGSLAEFLGNGSSRPSGIRFVRVRASDGTVMSGQLMEGMFYGTSPGNQMDSAYR